jgi:hypothetical protein
MGISLLFGGEKKREPLTALNYSAVRSHQTRLAGRFSATSGFPDERKAGSIARVPIVSIGWCCLNPVVGYSLECVEGVFSEVRLQDLA